MLPTADATAVPVTPRELSVGPQPRRNVTVLPVLQTVAVPRVSVPSRKGAGRHVDPSLACELERLNYSAWLAVGEALASLTDKVIERGRAAGVRVPVWKPTSELGMGGHRRVDGVESPHRNVRGRTRGGGRRHRGAAAYMHMNGFWCRRGLRCCCAQSNGCA